MYTACTASVEEAIIDARDHVAQRIPQSAWPMAQRHAPPFSYEAGCYTATIKLSTCQRQDRMARVMG